ncbi:MAG: HAD family hydrolase [Clostridia bacterium]|nr:HAD family hydrolase [Clostridia bacterium]
MEPKIIVFTDVGDTIIDEGTEVREVSEGVVYHAKCIPGAKETMLELHRRGYTIAMVADGLVESFHNILGENGLLHIFSTEVISEALHSQKPAQDMFQTAMDRLGLTDADKRRVLMVGNNIERDVVGANRFGIRSVLLDWSPRYRYQPHNPEEIPEFRIHRPEELIELVESINKTINE